MTYTGSKAFAGFTPGGTRTRINGTTIGEVCKIVHTPGKQVKFAANFVIGDPGQELLIALFLSQEPSVFAMELPESVGVKYTFDGTVSDINIVYIPAKEVKFFATFSIKDPADDGPEVEAIEWEQDIAWDESEIGKLIKQYFAEERAKYEPLYTETRPAGGGFVEVVDGHSYHYIP
ncbi:Uncharacterised protein [uncultured archaeon]|nr:Uncharacterised protein [uncultured archaeon]